MITENNVKRNAKLLEHAVHTLRSPELLSDFCLTKESHIRFTYDGIRYIVYHSGHVTISEPGIEIGGRLEATAMKNLLDV